MMDQAQIAAEAAAFRRTLRARRCSWWAAMAFPVTFGCGALIGWLAAR